MEIFGKKANGAFWPDPAFSEDFDKLPDNVMLRATLTYQRSLPHNRMYFAIIREMVKAGAGKSTEDIHTATKIKCGLYKLVEMHGEMMVFPDSTAFHRLDQIAFNEFFVNAVRFWKSGYLWDYISDETKEKIDVE